MMQAVICEESRQVGELCVHFLQLVQDSARKYDALLVLVIDAEKQVFHQLTERLADIPTSAGHIRNPELLCDTVDVQILRVQKQMVRIEQVIIERTERRHEAHEHLLQVVFSDPLHSAEDIKRLYRCDVISVAGLIVDVLLCHRQQSRNPVRLQNTRLPFRSRLSLFVCFQNHVAVIEITSVLSVVHVSASMPFLRCVWP